MLTFLSRCLQGLEETRSYNADAAHLTLLAIVLAAMGRWAEPEEIARMALFLASDESSWVTGAMSVEDGGFTAV